MSKNKKDWAYEVTLKFTGSYNKCTREEAINMIQDSIADETGISPDLGEINIWEDTPKKKTKRGKKK